MYWTHQIHLFFQSSTALMSTFKSLILIFQMHFLIYYKFMVAVSRISVDAWLYRQLHQSLQADIQIGQKMDGTYTNLLIAHIFAIHLIYICPTNRQVRRCHPRLHISSAVASLMINAIYRFVYHMNRTVRDVADFIMHCAMLPDISLRVYHPSLLGTRGIIYSCLSNAVCILAELYLRGKCCPV